MAADADDPLTDIACYHAQQCAEKCLKGYLVSKGIAFKFVHELAYLVRLCTEADAEFSSILAAASELQDYATDVRYPMEDVMPPSSEEAREANERAELIRNFVRRRLKAD